MPRCEGRPDETCPGKANDNSVKFTQGDLFLCPACEEFRFPSSILKPIVGTRKGSKKQSQAGEKSRPETCQIQNSSLSCDTCRRSYLGESLGIDEATLKQFSSIANIFGWVCATCRDVVRNQLSQLQSEHNSDVAQLKVDMDQLKQDISCLKLDLVSASRVSDPWPSMATSKELKKQILAVVHTDLDDSKRRQCNIIVSGLEPRDGITDADLFLDVCENNLTSKPFVDRNKCRRLGRPQMGKIQPLLICLCNAEAASSLLKASKQLCRSDDEHIRQKVFFNPDLTPGEAQAAFERRQKRRQRQEKQEQDGDDNTDNKLDATAADFVPSSVHRSGRPVKPGGQ
jgi:hypothetical protein